VRPWPLRRSRSVPLLEQDAGAGHVEELLPGRLSRGLPSEDRSDVRVVQASGLGELADAHSLTVEALLDSVVEAVVDDAQQYVMKLHDEMIGGAAQNSLSGRTTHCAAQGNSSGTPWGC